MKLKYIILIFAVLLFGGCSAKPTDYISVGYDSVFALKAKTEILSDEMIIDKDNKIEDFECKYPCVSYAFKCSFKADDKVISDYSELMEWFSQTCTEEYAQRIFDEIALIDHNNEIYYTAVDMLLDLYDYDSSKIVSYETNGNTVTYTCEASGSDGGGEPMELLTYTFSLINDKGNWKFADCSYNGYCNYRLLCDTLENNGGFAENSRMAVLKGKIYEKQSNISFIRNLSDYDSLRKDNRQCAGELNRRNHRGNGNRKGFRNFRNNGGINY